MVTLRDIWEYLPECLITETDNHAKCVRVVRSENDMLLILGNNLSWKKQGERNFSVRVSRQIAKKGKY